MELLAELALTGDEIMCLSYCWEYYGIGISQKAWTGYQKQLVLLSLGVVS